MTEIQETKIEITLSSHDDSLHHLIAEEKKALKKLELIDKKNMKLNQEFFLDSGYKNRLTKRILHTFEPFLQSFCQKYSIPDLRNFSKSFIFDSENYQQWGMAYPVAICGLQISHIGKVGLHLWIVNNVVFKMKISPHLVKGFQKYLTNQKLMMIGSHGGNRDEDKMVKPFMDIRVDTIHCLNQLRDHGFLPDHVRNLPTFEKEIGYERKACKYFKHKKWERRMWFQAMNHSLLKHIRQKPQRICGCCNKPQDVVQYCCEDAFSALLIFLLYKKYESEIEKQN